MGPPPFSAPALDPQEPASQGFRRVLLALAVTIAGQVDRTLADTDPEDLHQLRVAVRRSRSVLGEAKALLPESGLTHFGAELRWLGTITTEPRDLAVSVDLWPTVVAPVGPEDAERLVPVHDELRRRRDRSHGDLATTLGSERPARILREWCAWLRHGPDPKGPMLGAHVSRRVADRHRTLARDGRAIDHDSPAAQVHDLRKDAKKVRYLMESFAPLFPDKPRKAFVRRLQDLQTNLGDHQDAEVELIQLTGLAHDLDLGVDALLALGRLTRVVDEKRRHERERFAAVFAAYTGKANEARLERLLRSARP
jgi:CHAD domain-containing protein